jgi:hypothetical protein
MEGNMGGPIGASNMESTLICDNFGELGIHCDSPPDTRAGEQ